MKNLILFIGLFFIFVFNVNSQNVNELIKKSDEMYLSAKSTTDFDNLIKFLKDAEWNNKNNYEITWRLGRAISEKAVLLFITYLSENMNKRKISDVDDILDSDKSLESYQEKNLLELGKEGMFYMEKAKSLNSSRVETYYYMALSISMYGLGKSIVSALLEGISGKYESALNESIKIDRSYSGSGALRLYGRYYYVLPWPKRDYDKSEQYLKQAIQNSPNEILSHLYLGDTYWKLDKKDDAKNEWKKAKDISKPDGLEKILFDKIRNMIEKRLLLN
jgi:tetratricopeptide (TPR) repeat protein